MYFLLLFSVFLLNCDPLRAESVFGEKSDLYPKTSCLTINNVETTGQCFMRCLKAFEFHRLFSHSKNHKICMCCVDISGNDVLGYQWTTYVPRRCQEGYVTFNYTDDDICLKFVNQSKSYLEAASHCQAHRGYLFKLDTKQKYDILTEYLASVANGVTINVWIQSEKVGNKWQFHDGSPMPMDNDDVCPRRLDDTPNETRIRVRGSTNFECWDFRENKKYFFLCEYYRHFIFT